MNLKAAEGSRWRLPLEIRVAKREFQIKFDKAIVDYAEKPLDELKALLEKGIELPALTKMAIKMIVRAVEKGDSAALELVLYTSMRKRPMPKKSGKKDAKGAPSPSLPDPE